MYFVANMAKFGYLEYSLITILPVGVRNASAWLHKIPEWGSLFIALWLLIIGMVYSFVQK
jgi:hypothetical protein